MFILILMIFCHIVDDYYLQGILASLKQKSFWKENAPDKMYEHDYICALVMHGFSWAFMIMLPIAYTMNFQITTSFILALIANTIIHSFVDDCKANKHWINLIVDQALHMLQIAFTFLFFI